MSSRVRLIVHLCLSGLLAGLCSCTPSAQGPADEQKEPFYLTGKARESAMDYKGAIEAYEKALEANPQSGSAHFQLGLLYEREAYYAGAIYHFDRYLKLQPDSERTQIVKDRIVQNKMELAKMTTFAPMTQNLQRDFDRLTEENRQLRSDNEKLRTELATLQNRSATGGAAPPPTRSNPTDIPHIGAANPPGHITGTSGTGGEARAPVRVYTVKSGDTPSSIARKYNVKLDSLMAANPGLDPRRMQVGQSVKIPSP